MTITRQEVNRARINHDVELPYLLRVDDIIAAMQDIYDFFFDVNTHLVGRGLQRFDDMLRPANCTGIISDMMTDALATHSRSLTPNLYHNGHPDLIISDRYPGNRVKSAPDGIEIKSTRKKGGAVDTHGARDQTLAVFVYSVDNDRNRTAEGRHPLTFREVYIGSVTTADFRRNERGELGTRTATMHGDAIKRFREHGRIYYDWPDTVSDQGSKGSWRC